MDSEAIFYWNQWVKLEDLQSSRVFWSRKFWDSGLRIFNSTDFEVCGDNFSGDYSNYMEYTLMISSPSRTVLRNRKVNLSSEDQISPLYGDPILPT